MGKPIAPVIVTHEAGRDGFWLARYLQPRGVEIHVMQASSLPVDRRARRAKTDTIDAEMLLRTLLAWLTFSSHPHHNCKHYRETNPRPTSDLRSRTGRSRPGHQGRRHGAFVEDVDPWR